jgi:hypothetical protein
VYNVKTSNYNAFGERFGNKSVDLAINLLSAALKTEKNEDIKAEINRRLKIIDPQLATVKCTHCKTDFRRPFRKYKRYLCSKCLNERYTRKRQIE